ncbi:hypothetical protein PaelaDRAFT_3510 [Paenibacillus lactis 154]|uniref:Uncharacterized protein n=1 Tax=Paenibacillus lactis 154 TaxID=743719 RepID=G4HHP9_9BACL|nr:hypothetical protein PaelaDRAFT_3510 [Paenibacillus lactis 154]
MILRGDQDPLGGAGRAGQPTLLPMPLQRTVNALRYQPKGKLSKHGQIAPLPSIAAGKQTALHPLQHRLGRNVDQYHFVRGLQRIRRQRITGRDARQSARDIAYVLQLVSIDRRNDADAVAKKKTDIL